MLNLIGNIKKKKKANQNNNAIWFLTKNITKSSVKVLYNTKNFLQIDDEELENKCLCSIAKIWSDTTFWTYQGMEPLSKMLCRIYIAEIFIQFHQLYIWCSLQYFVPIILEYLFGPLLHTALSPRTSVLSVDILPYLILPINGVYSMYTCSCFALQCFVISCCISK